MSTKPLFLALLLSALGLQCNRNENAPSVSEEHDHTESSTTSHLVELPDSVQELIGIQVSEAKYRHCPTILKAMGKILAPRPRTAIVSHAFPGRVAEIHVEVGDWVEKGRSLVTLESQEVGQARCEFCTALAKCELARLNFAREQQLLTQGIGINKNFVAAEAEYKVAQTTLEVAEKKLHVLGFTEEQVKQVAKNHQINPTITLYAPIEGKVVDIKVVRGAMVDPATQILTIIDPRSLWIDAEIYEKDVAKVAVGQKVEVRVLAYEGRTFQGRVSYIGDVVSPDTRTITVRTLVDNAQLLLKPGMFADVNILLDEGQQVLVVPSAAVLEEGQQKSVFVKEGSRFARRQITTGTIYRECHQVVTGLKPGEQVVIRGNHQLKSKLLEGQLKAAHVH